jgi:tetratricopeptide (TPR) repeat protein
LAIEVPLKGDLREYPIAQIFISLNRTGMTGVFTVATPRFTKKVYFKDGDAIFAASNLEDDRLGEMLLKWGKINLQQYDRSVELLKKTGKRQGQILVELGYLTPKELYWAVKEQVREIIYSLFNLDHGEYEFVPGPLPTEEVITLRMSIGNLIYEGIKRTTNWSLIRRALPDNLVPRLSSNPLSLFQEIEFSETDKKIFTLIDGKRTVKQIIDNSWISPFDALKILYTLYCLEVIEEVRPEEEEMVTLSLEELFRPIVVEEDVFVKKVNEFYEKLGSANYFELLGVSDDAGVKTITKRYFDLTKEFHPDKSYNFSDPSLKEKLTAIVNALTTAYNLLKDPASREAYIRGITQRPEIRGESETGEEGLTRLKEKVVREPSARSLTPEASTVTFATNLQPELKGAIDLIKQGSPSSAIPVLKDLVKRSPQNPEIKNYLALAYLKTGQYGPAEEVMREAIRLKPSSEYFTNLGLIYIKAKKSKEAEEAFQKAIEINPQNEKARQYLEKLKKGK